LFGSKAKNKSNKESDIDILILLDQSINSKLEEEIYNICYEIELKYNIVFGKIIENKNLWNSNLLKTTPLYKIISKEDTLI
jgi:predicted nucleotidyltransferase